MLAESVVEWTREWERAGFEKGIERGVKQGVEQGVEQSAAALRALLLQKLTERFGFPVPEPSRRRVEGISSVVELAELIARVPQADSLAALDFEG